MWQIAACPSCKAAGVRGDLYADDGCWRCLLCAREWLMTRDGTLVPLAEGEVRVWPLSLTP